MSAIWTCSSVVVMRSIAWTDVLAIQGELIAQQDELITRQDAVIAAQRDVLALMQRDNKRLTEALWIIGAAAMLLLGLVLVLATGGLS